MWRLLEQKENNINYYLTAIGKHLLKYILGVVKSNKEVFEEYIGSFVDNFRNLPQEISERIGGDAVKIVDATNISYQSIIGFLGFYLKHKCN